jgi:hypothetical protein
MQKFSHNIFARFYIKRMLNNVFGYTLNSNPVTSGNITGDLNVNGNLYVAGTTELGGNVKMDSNATVMGNFDVQGTSEFVELATFDAGIDTPSITSPNVDSNNNPEVNMDCHVYMSSSSYFSSGSSSGGSQFKRIAIYDPQRGQNINGNYMGFYVSANNFGHQLPFNNNINFTMATTSSPATSNYLGTEILGNGGITYFPVNAFPGSPTTTGAYTIFSDGDQLLAIRSDGTLTQLESRYINLYNSVSTSTTCTLANTNYSLQATTWSTTSSIDFTNSSTSGNNLVTYNGTDGTTFNIMVSISMSSSTNNHTSTFSLYKNPTFSGTQITSGTLLNSNAFLTYDTASAFYNCSLLTTVVLGPNDTIGIAIADTAALSINTANSCSLTISTF